MFQTTQSDSHTDSTETDAARDHPWRDRARQLGAALFALTGLLFVVQGVLSTNQTYLNHGFETGVARLDGMTATELADTYPEVASYIAHLHLSFAVLMIATGLGIVALAYYGILRGRRWALATALLMPVLFGAVMIAVHGSVEFGFDLLIHLGPAGIGTVLVLAGGVAGWIGME